MSFSVRETGGAPIRAYICECPFICVCVRSYAYVCSYVCVCVYVCMHVFLSVYVCEFLCVYVAGDTPIRAYVCACRFICMRECTCVCVYVCAYTSACMLIFKSTFCHQYYPPWEYLFYCRPLNNACHLFFTSLFSDFCSTQILHKWRVSKLKWQVHIEWIDKQPVDLTLGLFGRPATIVLIK